MKWRQAGFTLVEIAVVLLIVTILLGYTIALFPRQQELKQYNAVEKDMDRIAEAIIAFAQVNGRLPCPAIPSSVGAEAGGGGAECTNFGGFVPVNTLGLAGRLNGDSLMLDPWSAPYRYYVTGRTGTFTAAGVASVPAVLLDQDASGNSDFVVNTEMRNIGLVDSDADNYLDLDGQYIICDQADARLNDECEAPATMVFGNFSDHGGPYGGAVFVLVSHGKNNRPGLAQGDELVNMGANTSDAITTRMAQGPMGVDYRIKDIEVGDTTFVRRPTGFADDFDDVIFWVSPNVLYSRMIAAGQLP